MGMGPWMLMRRIVLPSAIRRMLPAYGNEVVMMLHSSSLASTVPALLDLTGAPAASTPTLSAVRGPSVCRGHLPVHHPCA